MRLYIEWFIRCPDFSFFAREKRVHFICEIGT